MFARSRDYRRKDMDARRSKDFLRQEAHVLWCETKATATGKAYCILARPNGFAVRPLAVAGARRVVFVAIPQGDAPFPRSFYTGD